MTRMYSKWAGNLKGIPEDLTRCIASVSDDTGWHFNQCKRKRGYGPNGEYCKQHAKRFPSSDNTVDKVNKK